MKNAILKSGRATAGVMALALMAAPAARADFMVDADANATVQPGGPRTGASGTNFMNIEGSDNNAFASFGVIDFTAPTGQPMASVTGLAVTLTESDAAFTTPGGLVFYVTTDTGASIANDGSSSLAFDATDTPGGLGSQLSTLYTLGTGSFTSTGNTNTGQVDTFTFAPDATTAAYLEAQIAAGGTIRIVIAATDATTAATFAGATNTTLAGPQLTITTNAVPEPATIGMVGFGGIALMIAARRRTRARA